MSLSKLCMPMGNFFIRAKIRKSERYAIKVLCPFPTFAVMKYLGYLGFRLGVFLLSVMPFGLMYRFSDFLAFVLRDVLKYRRRVAEENLRRVFPDMSEEVFKRVLRAAYVNLSDVLLEGIKGQSMSRRQLLERYRFVNPELLDALYERGGPVLSAQAHYGNWEWGVTSFPLQVRQRVVGIYKPLKHPYIGAYTDARRSRYGLILRDLRRTRHAMREFGESPVIYIMIADQSPSNPEKSHWISFFGRKTAWLHGTDYWARELKCPVVFMDVQRRKRGFYEIRFSLLADASVQAFEEGEITRAYVKKLEEIIAARPENWLWTHRRWKLTP